MTPPKPTTPTLAQVLAAGDDAQGAAITGLRDPLNPQDAATRAYVDAHRFPTGWKQDASSPAMLETKGGTLFVNAPGTIEFEGRGAASDQVQFMGGNRIAQLGIPIEGGDASNRDYVDQAIAAAIAALTP